MIGREDREGSLIVGPTTGIGFSSRD